MTKEFNNLEELEPYYDEKTNTYVFKEDRKYIDVKLNFSLAVHASIDARNIDARNINARNIDARNINACNINAWDINAWDINAGDIEYYAVCVSYNNIICKSIKGTRDNCFHKALDGEIIIKEKGDK